MKIVMTGGTGFVGKHLTRALSQLGNQVVNIGRYDLKPGADDLVNAYLFELEHPKMSGIYHLCAPNPVTNLGFTRTLGAALHRPTLFRVPELLLKLAYGEGAEVMTSGQQVVSERLPESGFRFRHATLESAVAEIVSHNRGKPNISGFVNSKSET